MYSRDYFKKRGKNQGCVYGIKKIEDFNLLITLLQMCIQYRENISIVSSNSEASASELQETLEEIFPRYL